MSSVVNEKYYFWHLQQKSRPDGEPEAKWKVKPEIKNMSESISLVWLKYILT